MTIGVLALQGGFAAHQRVLDQLGLPNRQIRQAAELENLDALILPGGESTAMIKLMDLYQMWLPLQAFAERGKPILGTCAGAILMVEKVNFRDQRSLGWLPTTISRNVYGSQRDSFLTTQELLAWENQTVSAFFIRAPRFDALGDGVEVLSRYKDDITGVIYKHFTAITYHPELSDDVAFHRAWAKQGKLFPAKP